MRIFLSFLQGKPHHPIPSYSFWEYYIKNGIEEAGHTWTECIEVDWAEGLVPKSDKHQESWKEISWTKTLDFLKKNQVDVFLSYLYPQQIDKTAIREIRRLGIPTINFFCDHIREFFFIPQEFSEFNLNWVPEKKAIEMYQRAGFNSCYAPMPMWIEPKYRTPQTHPNKYSISFIGSKDIQRQLFFEEVLTKNFSLPLTIYGSGWKLQEKETSNIQTPIINKIWNQLQFISKFGIKAYQRKVQQLNSFFPYSENLTSKTSDKLDFERYISITRNSTVTIGINRFPSFSKPFDRPPSYSRLRDIEAPMLGACYLTEYTDGLEDLFEIGKDVLTYTNSGDFLIQINEIISSVPLQIQLRKNGQQKALNILSIPTSLNKLFDAL